MSDVKIPIPTGEMAMNRTTIGCIHRFAYILSLLLMLLAIPGRSNAQLVVRKQVLSSGGRSDGGGGTFLLSGTIGQPFVGVSGSGASRLFQGFWNPRPTVSAVDVADALTGESKAVRSYPNPFDEATTIAYTLPGASTVSLRVFDMSGSLVRVLVDGVRPGGSDRVVWDGLDLAGEPVATSSYLIVFDAVPIDGALGKRITVRSLVMRIR